MGNPSSNTKMDSYILDVSGYTTMPKYDYPANDISCTIKPSLNECANACTGTCLGFAAVARGASNPNCCLKSAVVGGKIENDVTFYKKI
jgi:hypothetical protein